MPDFDRLFSQFRDTPWRADPNGVPQEGLPGNGNPESSGWIADDAITADTIQANAVTAGKIAADAVTANEIAANTITANEIAANTITANEIAANTITASEIAANTITASEIAANAVTASEIAANTITASEIAASAITASELAADSVITSKILAGNVVSSKIELTLSGKNFGANDGSESTPGVYFDVNSDTGMYRLSTSSMGFSAGGSTKLSLHSGIPAIFFYDNVEPAINVTYDLGSPSRSWDTVYRFTEVSPSDERLKYDITDEPLGLEFVRALRPRGYRWRETLDRIPPPDRQAKLMEESAEHEERIREARRLQLSGDLSDERAETIIAAARRQLRAVAERHRSPAPKKRPGKRLHHGLIAQEVGAVLDEMGFDTRDAAFWRREPDGMLSLSYTELIAPMLKAIQELDRELQELKQSLNKRNDE